MSGLTGFTIDKWMTSLGERCKDAIHHGLIHNSHDLYDIIGNWKDKWDKYYNRCSSTKASPMQDMFQWFYDMGNILVKNYTDETKFVL